MVVRLHCILPSEIPTTEVGINTDTWREDGLIERFIKNNWSLTDPDADQIAFGYALQQMDRAKAMNKHITLHCYNVPGTSRMVRADTAGLVFDFEVRVRVDVGLRDVRASGGGTDTVGGAQRPLKLTSIDKYLQEFITVNAGGLVSNGIKDLSVTGYPEFVGEMEGNDITIYHYVLTVMVHYQKIISGDSEAPVPVDVISTSYSKWSTPIALRYVQDLSLIDTDPPSQYTFLYVTPVDSFNDGLFLRLRKNGGFVDLQLA